MPKRKALGPADASDEEEDYHSFPSTPIQSPFPKIISSNFNHPPSRVMPVPVATPSNFFGLGGSSRQAVPAKLPLFGVKNIQSSTLTSVGTTTPTNLKTTSTSSNQDFSKSVRDLNVAFNKSVRTAVSKNASHSLLPLVKDYLFHSRVLLEQCKRGGTQADLVNGINVPPKNFKSLGEYFDDFEKRYVEHCPEDATADDTSSGKIGTPNSKHSIEAEASKSPFKSALGVILSPSKSDITTNTMPVHQEPTNVLIQSSPTSGMNKLENNRVSSPSFFGKITPSVPVPLKSSSTSTSSSWKSPVDPPPPPPPIAKPSPFAGFSFFIPPVPGTSLAIGSLPTTTPASNSEVKNQGDDGEDEEPPKVELVPVKEDDAVYSKRCKVFGVVEGKCKDKGVGMLYVKKLDDGRHQIVVRADNNLGTVILNILLQKSLPLDKNGKNTIMTVDLQANDKKGMPIIIKVKTEDDALELLGKLKEFQQIS